MSLSPEKEAEWTAAVSEARAAIWDDGRGMIGRRNRDQLQNRVARAILSARRDERARAEASSLPLGWVAVPADDPQRPFSDSTLPLPMIEAGADTLERARDDLANYKAGSTPDWDYGMEAVAVYRAMIAAAPVSGASHG